MLTLTTGLTYWTDDVNSTSPIHSWAFWAGLYALLQVCALLSLFSLGITLWVFAVKRAGAALHEDALATLVRAPLRYFTQTDTGVITNLFSQDLNLIDTELPNALLDTLYSVSPPANWASSRKVLLIVQYTHTKNALRVTYSLALNLLLTNACRFSKHWARRLLCLRHLYTLPSPTHSSPHCCMLWAGST